MLRVMQVELMSRSAVRDRDDFSVFYEHHVDDLHRAVRATLNDARLAEEAVAEGFVRAAERWSSVATMDRPAGWVYRVAVNWATSWRRKLRRRPTLPAEQLDRPYLDQHHGATVLPLLEGLALDRRQLLVLRYVLGYSVEESAAVMGIAPGTVKSRTSRAVEQLRADLEVTHDA